MFIPLFNSFIFTFFYNQFQIFPIVFAENTPLEKLHLYFLFSKLWGQFYIFLNVINFMGCCWIQIFFWDAKLFKRIFFMFSQGVIFWWLNYGLDNIWSTERGRCIFMQPFEVDFGAIQKFDLVVIKLLFMR